jgi:SAM-dependent methyltransferase
LQRGESELPDRIFTEQKLADLYDIFNPWGARTGDDQFYMEFIMAAKSVLDVGCGTGLMLRTARELGHSGRLVGLDPAQAMLDVGRRDRTDIEWTYGDLTSARFDQEFDLIIMSGHAFQVFLSDEELKQALLAIRAALTPDGRFVFETRNPGARQWDRWVPENAVEIDHPTGGKARMEHNVDLPVEGELVSFTTRFTAPTFEGVLESRSTLRFLDQVTLNRFLNEAGFTIDAQYGFWDRSPVTEMSPEIISVVRAA